MHINYQRLCSDSYVCNFYLCNPNRSSWASTLSSTSIIFCNTMWSVPQKFKKRCNSLIFHNTTCCFNLASLSHRVSQITSHFRFKMSRPSGHLMGTADGPSELQKSTNSRRWARRKSSRSAGRRPPVRLVAVPVVSMRSLTRLFLLLPPATAHTPQNRQALDHSPSCST